MARGVRRERAAGTARSGGAAPVRGAREAWLFSGLLLLLFAAFCLTPNWGRILPEAWRQTGQILHDGTEMTAAERRALFYDETYPVLWYLRENTPADAVILLPPSRFMKEQVMSRRPPGEDLTPLLGLASSAYSFLYPRVPVNFGEPARLQDRATHLLVWDHWGLDRIDASQPRTEENRIWLVELTAEPGGAPPGTGGAPARWNGRTVEESTGPDRWITLGLFLGLAALAGLGEGLTRLLRRVGALLVPAASRLDLLEAVALRLLLGLAAVPWVAIVCDLASIPITRATFLGAAALVLVAGWWSTRGVAPARESRQPLPPGQPRSPEDDPSDAGLRPAGGHGAWLRSVAGSWGGSLVAAPAASILSAVAVALVLCGLVQIAILPERNYDALVGYDLVGKIMSYEGRYVSSVFDRITYNAQCVYAPFTAASIGYGYLFHPIIQRLWVTLLVGSFLVLFHRRVARWSGSRTAAALAVPLFLLPRVVFTQTTVGMTDLPSMVFTALALFAIVDHLRGEGGTAPALVMLLAASTARTENLLFGGAMAVAVIAAGVRARARARRGGEDAVTRPDSSWRLWWRGGWLLAAPSLFFVFWNFLVVREKMGYDPAAHFTPPGVDPGRLVEVVTRAASIIGMTPAFGHFWLLIPLAIALWFASWTARRRGGAAPRVPGAAGSIAAAGASAVSGPSAAIDSRTESERSATVSVPGALLLVLGLMFVAYLPFFYLWDPLLNPLWTMEHTFKRGFMRFMPGIVAAVCCAPWVARLLSRCER